MRGKSQRGTLRRKLERLAVLLLVTSLVAGMLPLGEDHAAAGTGGVITTIAGGEYGDWGDGGAAVDAELSNPSAIAIDGSGNIYIADTDNNKIRKITGGTITTFAGTGDYGFAGEGLQAINAELRSPTGVAVDAAGNVYVADKYNNRVRKIATDGVITTIAGTGSSDYSGDNGDATAAELSSPSGVAVDSVGNVYIADTSNHRIRKVDTAGKITTVAGTDDSGYSGDGVPADETRLYYPNAVAIDAAGNLYIADTYNNRIRKVDTDGIITTVAGSSSTDGYSGDGDMAVDAQLNEPEGVWVDGSGNLYIADTDNNRIRKVIPNGIITTIAGTGGSGYSGDGGAGTLAELDGPTGLAMDSAGNLYIADKFNYAVRKQTPYIPSSAASLSGIVLSSGTLSPTFSSSTLEYTAEVVNGVSSIRVTPTTSDSLMKVKVNGVSVASGSLSGDITLDVGDNTIELVVTAEDGVTTQLYKVTVDRLRSSNANLSNLTLSSGTLDSAFSSSTTTYNTTVGRSSITVTPTLADTLASVTVNGTPVTSGAASAPISLTVGSGNTITVKVTAQDGTTTKTYTINATRTISSNADLSGLTLSSGILSPAFAAGENDYTASVGNDVSSITVTPTLADSSAAVTVNGVTVDSGTASDALPLVVGVNTIEVLVTAEDGTENPYEVTVTRAKSSNAELSDLELSSGTVTPSFIPGTYKASVGNGVSSVTITPTAADSAHAAIKVSLFNGSGTLVSGPSSVASGTASSALALGIGSNTITVEVTAEDGTTKTYTVTVTRGASGNAELNNLTLSSGTLTPAFGGTYTASVGLSVSSITVTATVADSSATVTVNGDAVTSGAASDAIPLVVGSNTITVVVTAADGTTKTYTITVTRADATLSGNADLSGLTLSSGTLTATFGNAYTASVGNSVSSITVTATAADSVNATLTVNGDPVANGVASDAIPLVVGSNTITVVVTAADGTTKTYTITVTRAAVGLSGNADLSGLTLSSGTLTAAFGNAYTANVGNSVSSVKVTATVADSSATVTVGGDAVASGVASDAISLDVGSNTITVVVTAADATTKTYTITVTRADANLSGNADLSGLTLSSGTLTATFGNTYTASVGNSVSSVTVTATAADSVNATLTVNGAAVASGDESDAIPLVVGSNTITVVVTAADGTTKTYTITVTRSDASLSGNADLSGLTLSSGTLSPEFEPGTIDYTSSVENGVSSITVTMEVSDADKAAITVSVYNSTGTLISGPFAMSSGVAAFSLPLIEGSNEVSIIVRTQGGATQTYTVDITREAASSGGGGGGGVAPAATNSASDTPHIDLNGQDLNPADIDTKLPYVTLEATPKDGVAFVSVPVMVLAELALKNSAFYLEIKTPYGSYRLPAKLASLIPELPDLLADNDLQAGDVSLKVTLTDKSGDKELQAALAEGLPNSQALGPMVDFHMEAINTKTGQPIGTASSFSQAITRVIPMPLHQVAMSEQWGAFRFNESTGKFDFVPAATVRVDGITSVLIRSYSNSVYVVADHAVSFADVARGWALPFIELAAAKGLVEGVGAGKYEPTQTVSRAEFATMLVRALGRGASPTGASAYTDVKPGAWYYDAIVSAKELGLLEFVGGKVFLPNRPLTREEMASMLAAAVSLERLPIPQNRASLEGYADIGSVNEAYLEDVRTMIQLNIMAGTSANTFSPKGTTTREQAAAVLIRTLQVLDWLDSE
ncbi:cadherin-like beta sandwich domain-containing protein [Cohnella fermenti]|nr:cadherin-like beta sandwich domain-containing protein [Cohnella fermenti]